MACRLNCRRPCTSTIGSLPEYAHLRTSGSATPNSAATSFEFSPVLCSSRTPRVARGEFAQILQEAVDKGQRMWRAPGNVKIDLVFLDELARELSRSLKDAATDCAGAEENQQFRSRHGLVGRFQRVRHRACGRTGDDDAIRVSRRGDKLDAETAHVEVYIAKCVQFQLTTITAACRH